MATKKRKKKNVKMRRQIWKTVSAILMIMAIVVAAIPVERYGRMEASTESKGNLKVSDLYNMYMNYHQDNEGSGGFQLAVTDADNFEMTSDTDYSGVISCIRRIQNSDMLYWSFRYKDRTQNGITTAVIVDYNDNYLESNVTLNSSMPKDYWIITTGFVDAFIQTISSERFGVKANLVTETAGDGTTSFTIPSSFTIAENGNTSNGTMSLTTSVADQNTIDLYTQYYPAHNTKFDYSNDVSGPDFFTKYGDSFTGYQSLKTAVQEYEDRISSLKSAIDAAKQITDDASRANTLNNLNNDAQTLRNDINADARLTIQYTSNDVKNSLGEKIYEYIGSRIYLYTTEGESIPLGDKYEFAEVIDTNHFSGSGTSTQTTIRVPKYNGPDEQRPSNTDESGYLFYGKIGVSGIGNKAFQNAGITNLTVSDQFEFIGNEAFIGCSNLDSLTVRNCKVIGNRAFAGCNISNISFTGDEGTGSALQEIGAQAFEGCTRLSSLQFPNSIRHIGAGAFANCTGLTSIKLDDTTSNDIYIWPFAFYNCSKLGDTGPGGTDDSYFLGNDFTNAITIGLGAFALTNSGGNMKEFVFPQSMDRIIKPSGSDKFELSAGSFFNYIDTNYDAILPSEFGREDASDSDYMTREQYFKADEFMYDFILAGRSGLEHVTFPSDMTTNSRSGTERIPDNTLMGCTDLEYVTMGAMSCDGSAGNAITYDSPDVKVENSSGGTDTVRNDLDKDGETLFQDIKTTGFYVEGPGFFDVNNKTAAAPRKATWTAQTTTLDAVPYKYKDTTGKDCLEIALDGGKYLASIEVIDESSKTAKLIAFISNPNFTSSSQYIRRLTIPEIVAGYNIKELGAGCFSEVSDKVLEFVIQDNSIEHLEADAFAGSDSLLKVSVGNSVKSIGDRAFYNCPKLENVYFSEPLNVSVSSSTTEWANALTLGTDAFATKSDYLTFHGPIHSGYQPYEYAMSGNTLSVTSKKNICYKTDTPMNLTVMYDNKTGLPTCVDYPHYEDIDSQNVDFRKELVERYKENYLAQKIDEDGDGNYDEYQGPGAGGIDGIGGYSIVDKFEQLNGFRTDKTQYDGMTMEQDEEDIVFDTFMMTIPDGVASIDAKAYLLASENSANLDYMNRYYEETEDATINCIKGKQDIGWDKRYINDNAGGETDVSELYSNDSSITDDVTVKKAGLYSGYFNEDNPNNVIGNTTPFQYGSINHNLVESVPTGNDNLLTMTLKSVESLPSYAFNSCENLLSVDLGEKCKQTGIAPFRGCDNLTDIVGNDTLVYSNGLLLQKGPVTAQGDDYDYTIADGKYRIIESVEGRGDLIGQKTITSTNDPIIDSVESLSEEAFAYCEDIKEIDLSKTTITKVPKGCFKNMKILEQYISLLHWNQLKMKLLLIVIICMWNSIRHIVQSVNQHLKMQQQPLSVMNLQTVQRPIRVQFIHIIWEIQVL